MAQPLDRGRLVAVVDTYQSNTEVDQNNQPKIKPKYMQIGEATKWPNETGGYRIAIKQFLNPPSLPCETRIFWESENNNQQAPAPQNQAPAQQQAPQYQQPPAGGYQQR